MRYTLKKVLRIAERYGVYIGIEPHQSITKTTEGLLRLIAAHGANWAGVQRLGRPRSPSRADRDH